MTYQMQSRMAILIAYCIGVKQEIWANAHETRESL